MFYEESARFSTLGNRLIETLLERFGPDGLSWDNFGLVVLRDRHEGQPPLGFAYRGDWLCYPCSVVKAFHLVHALHELDTGRIEPPEDLDRAIRDMILWSSNTATNYVIDIVTGTTGDTRLNGSALAEWFDEREASNRFFRSLDWPEFTDCNITQKLSGDTRYGREAQFASLGGGYLNALTPLASARLFHELFAGKLPLSETAYQRASDTLLRDRTAPEASMPGFQVAEYLGDAMPDTWTIWSKAGQNPWTGDERTSYFKHDLIRAKEPGFPALIVSLMTRGQTISDERTQTFPEIGRCILEAFES